MFVFGKQDRLKERNISFYDPFEEAVTYGHNVNNTMVVKTLTLLAGCEATPETWDVHHAAKRYDHVFFRICHGERVVDSELLACGYDPDDHSLDQRKNGDAIYTWLNNFLLEIYHEYPDQFEAALGKTWTSLYYYLSFKQGLKAQN